MRENSYLEWAHKKGWITWFTNMIYYLYISKLTTENSQTKTKHQSVSEVEAGLEEAWHLGFHKVVVYRVQVHIDCCWGSREEWCPLPVIVLSI